MYNACVGIGTTRLPLTYSFREKALNPFVNERKSEYSIDRRPLSRLMLETGVKHCSQLAAVTGGHCWIGTPIVCVCGGGGSGWMYTPHQYHHLYSPNNLQHKVLHISSFKLQWSSVHWSVPTPIC